MIKIYDSPRALLDDGLRLNALGVVSELANGSDFFGGETQAQTIQRTRSGDKSLVPLAEKYVDQLEAKIEVPRRRWVGSPAGAFPVVPDALRGLPTSMRKIIHEQDEHSPITIYQAMSSAGSIDAETLEKRGAVTLALVLALSRIRPISLNIIHYGDGNRDKTNETITIAQINTSPLDLATACYCLTSQGFARRLCYGLANRLNNYQLAPPPAMGSWSNLIHQMNWLNKLAVRLGKDPNATLMIPRPWIGDPMLTNPVAWINDKIKFFTEKQEEMAS